MKCQAVQTEISVCFADALTECRNGGQQYSDEEGPADVSLPTATHGWGVCCRNGKSLLVCHS